MGGLGFYQIDFTVSNKAELITMGTDWVDGALVFLRDEDRFLTWDIGELDWIEPQGGWLFPVMNKTTLEAKYARDGAVAVVLNEGAAYIREAGIWVPLVAKTPTSLGYIQGCNTEYVDSSHITVRRGTIDIKGSLVTNAVETVFDITSALESGSLQNNTWHYIYAEVSTSGMGFTVFTSTLIPTKSFDGLSIIPYEKVAKYHQSRDARCVGTFLTTGSGSIMEFRKEANYVHFVSNDNTPLVITQSAPTRTSLDVSSRVPATSDFVIMFMFPQYATSATKSLGTSSVWLVSTNDSSITARMPLDDAVTALTGGVATASGVYNSNVPGNAIDGDPNTSWKSRDSAPTLYVDMGVYSTPVTAVSVLRYETDLQVIEVSSRNSASDPWVLKYTGNALGNQVNLSVPTTDRYWKAEIISIIGTINGIAEFKLFSADRHHIYYTTNSTAYVTLTVLGYYEFI